MVNPLKWLFQRYEPPEPLTPVVSVDALQPWGLDSGTPLQALAPWARSLFDGEKYPGGFGLTVMQEPDYWMLRLRSSQLFNENLYARGLIRRLVTNEISTGLLPELAPAADIIGRTKEQLVLWTEQVETRFAVWAKSPQVCDWRKADSFAALQSAARLEALVSGDVLVVLRQSQQTRLPQVQLVSGNAVRTPLMGQLNMREGHKIRHGVETDTQGRVVAYWVEQEDRSTKRLPAFGEKSRRRMAWLVFGTDKRLDDVRGQPVLALILQSLREIDRYRDAVQRKALLNSTLAMFIKKTEDKPGSKPLSGAAVRRGTSTVTDEDGTQRNFNIATQVPGMVLETLQQGEEPVGFGSQGTDLSFGPFEEAIVHSLAWANEIPPEILRLTFSNNYSASQAAINEFRIYLNRVWNQWGETFCGPIYAEWLVSEVLLGKIEAPGFLEAWRDLLQYDIRGGWLLADWYGAIKPSTDPLKQVKASVALIAAGLSTRAREARVITGTKFSTNINRLMDENQQLADANAPLLPEPGSTGDTESAGASRPAAAGDDWGLSALDTPEEHQDSPGDA